MNESPRWGLPLLSAGQAQKEITHNEALVLLDALTQASVVGAPSTAPPSQAAAGECVIVATPATGAFTGHEDEVAIQTEGGWRFVIPRAGMCCIDSTTGRRWIYRSQVWIEGVEEVASLSVGGAQVVGEQQPPIADPTGGSTVDTEARDALMSILTILRAHGLISA